MICPATLDGGTLPCVRETEHTAPKGCVYVGSSVADGHDASEQAAEADRG